MKQETERKQENKQTEQKTRWFNEDLPSLIERDIETSLSHDNKLWALKFANPEDIGMSYWSKDFGVMLQNVGGYRIRCIMAFDSPDARIGLAMFCNTFSAVGVEFELGEYTVVAPLVEQEEATQEADETGSLPGMEVV